MGALEIAWLVVAALFGAATFTMIYMNYRRTVEATRPDAWAAMMHERIMDERDGPAGPP